MVSDGIIMVYGHPTFRNPEKMIKKCGYLNPYQWDDDSLLWETNTMFNDHGFPLMALSWESWFIMVLCVPEWEAQQNGYAAIRHDS